MADAAKVPGAAAGLIGVHAGATLAGLTLAAGLFAAALLYIRHGFVDDSFIFFRYAENLASGQGLVWNIGEAPVEGHSSFFWLLLLTAAHLTTGIDLPLLAYWLGIAGGLAALLLAWRLARKCLSEIQQPLAVLAPIALAASPLLARHAINGLETSVTVLFYLAMSCLWASAWLNRAGSAVILGIAAFLGVLIRPDSPAFSIPGSAAAVVLAAGDWRAALKHLVVLGLCFAVLLAGFLLWKVAVFGGVLPLPALIKFSPPEFHNDVHEVRRMLGFWLGFAGLLAPYGMLGLAGAAMLRFKLPIAAGPVIAGSLGFACYMLTTVPIMNFDWRLHYPVMPPLVALALALWCGGISRYKTEIGMPRAVAAVLTVSLAWLALDGAALAPQLRRFAEWDLMTAGRHEALGRALAKVPDVTVAYSEAGRVPFYSKARVFDVAGLNDRFVAEHWRAGDIDQVFERYLVDVIGLPDVIVRSPEAYGYARFDRLPALQGLYEPGCFDGLEVYLRTASPRHEAVKAALHQALVRTTQQPCPDS